MPSRPRAVCACSMYPLPITSGGRKRTARLLDAVAQTGLVPHVVCAGPVAAVDLDAGRERGWVIDVLAPGGRRPAELVRQHSRLALQPEAPGLRARLEELCADGTGFVMFDQIAMAPYLPRHSGCVPSVLSVHNVDSEIARALARVQRPGSEMWVRDWYRYARVRRIERRAARLADAVVCVSEEDARYFAAAGANAVVAPNGADDAMFAVPHAPPPDEHVLLFAEWPYRPNRNGLERFIHDGWPRIAQARPRARLRLAGMPAQDKLSRLRAEVPAADRIDILGFVEDLPGELARARMVVVPIWQGSGTRLKVVESMAAARPVVGTSLGVENVGFVDGAHGLVDDTAEGLAAGVCALLADPQRAGRMGIQARAHAEQFRWERALAPAQEVWARLADRG